MQASDVRHSQVCRMPHTGHAGTKRLCRERRRTGVCLDGGSCRRRVDDRRETTRTNMSFSGSKSRLCTAGSNGHDLVDLSALAHLVVLGPAAHLPCSGFVFSRLGVSPQLLCEVGPGGVTWSGPGVKDRVSNGRMCCKEPLMLRSGRLQSRQVAGRARGAGLPAPGLAEGRAHCGANRVGACCGEGQGAEQAHLAGEEGRSSRSPILLLYLKTTPTAARSTANLHHRCTHAFAPPSKRRLV